jgi:hypothetical protein
MFPKGRKFYTQTDFNCGAHIVAGISHLFSNSVFTAIEEQLGVNYYPSKVEFANEILVDDKKIKTQLVKGFDFITLARVGYKFRSLPAIAYVSSGIYILKMDIPKSRNVCRPKE